ncbi:ATP-binding protein [Rhodohalobacter mucosus]|uniref:ATP-binding protein n=1 Tax=Rhodohalobacter mucosus TaxID=2079485 RepID=A0A316TY54_9BACT|nr:ATP-binding protein [Rhodohalobacter mucosus]PWN07732.1 ATP-binding protein [Rhodohalobacter mucosus]
MANESYRLTLKSTYEESERIPDFVNDLQSRSSLNEDETSTLMLLLSEAVTNAIEHGNQNDEDKNVDVSILIDKDAITSIVSDEGEGFDPSAVKDPLKEENLLDVGGRGIFLIRELSDTFEFEDEGRTVRFTIKRQQ